MFAMEQTALEAAARVPPVRCSRAQLTAQTPQLESAKLTRGKEEDMLATIAAVLFILWLLGFFAFHVTSGLIHILLVIGLIMIVMHFVSGSRTAV